MDTAATVCILCGTILCTACVYVLPPPCMADSPFDPLLKNSIEGFHVTSYQANFASHPTRARHVGFLLHGRV